MENNNGKIDMKSLDVGAVLYPGRHFELFVDEFKINDEGDRIAKLLQVRPISTDARKSGIHIELIGKVEDELSDEIIFDYSEVKIEVRHQNLVTEEEVDNLIIMLSEAKDFVNTIKHLLNLDERVNIPDDAIVDIVKPTEGHETAVLDEIIEKLESDDWLSELSVEE